MSDNIIKESIAPQVSAPAEAETPAPVVTEEIASEAPEAPVETPAEEAAAPESSTMEARLNEFMRREGEWETQRLQMRKEMDALKQQAALLEEFNSLKDSNPLEALTKLNVNPDDMIDGALGINKPEVSEIDQLKQELEALKHHREEEARKQQEQANAKAEADYLASISSFINENAAKYELCSVYGDEAVNDMYTVLNYDYGQLLDQGYTPAEAASKVSLEKAAEAVENHYMENYKKLSSAKKFRQPETVTESPVINEKKTQPSTLTTKTNSTASRQIINSELDIEQSKRNAAKTIRWK